MYIIIISYFPLYDFVAPYIIDIYQIIVIYIIFTFNKGIIVLFIFFTLIGHVIGYYIFVINYGVTRDYNLNILKNFQFLDFIYFILIRCI